MQRQHNQDTTPSTRQAYGAPQLVEFGRVQDLTAGGSQGNNELKGGANSKQRP